MFRLFSISAIILTFFIVCLVKILWWLWQFLIVRQTTMTRGKKWTESEIIQISTLENNRLTRFSLNSFIFEIIAEYFLFSKQVKTVYIHEILCKDFRFRICHSNNSINIYPEYIRSNGLKAIKGYFRCIQWKVFFFQKRRRRHLITLHIKIGIYV